MEPEDVNSFDHFIDLVDYQGGGGRPPTRLFWVGSDFRLNLLRENERDERI